jgi:hypothetical protein
MFASLIGPGTALNTDDVVMEKDSSEE